MTTDILTQKNVEDRLRRTLRWHDHYLCKPRWRRSEYRYLVMDGSNTCIDGSNVAEDRAAAEIGEAPNPSREVWPNAANH